MGNCLSHSAQPGDGSGAAAKDAGAVTKADVVCSAKHEALPEPVKPAASAAGRDGAKCSSVKEAEEVQELTKPGEVPNAIVNPETDLILNMLDPVNGPAAGLPYQVHYLGPPRPPCEAERLATVDLLGKIGPDIAPDPEISCILKLVANVFKAPAALCALFDDKRVFISEQEGDVIPCGTFPWRWTLCGWSMAFKNPHVLVIQDTLQDARFRNNEKCTTFPKVRFYCGAPLVASNGHRLGTLCFADIKPRKFDMASCVMMNNLSELVVRQLEKDIAIKVKEKANKQLMDTFRNLQRAVDCYEHCVVLLDTSEDGWKVMYANAAWTKQTGMSRDQLVGSALRDVLEATDGTQLPSPALRQSIKDLKGAKVSLARIKDASVTKTFSLTFRPAGRQVLDESVIPIGVPSFLSLDEGEDDVAHRFYFMTIAAPGENKRSSTHSFGVPASLLSSYSSTSTFMLDPHSSVGGASSILGGPNQNSMQGLELAHLLGRGSFGWVYYGLWFGTPVAVKIIDEDVRVPAASLSSCGKSASNNKALGGAGAGGNSSVSASAEGVQAGGGGGLVPHLEALMAHELRHPNIVATLKYGTHMVPCGRAPDREDYMQGQCGGNGTSHLSGSSTFPTTASNLAVSAQQAAADHHAVGSLCMTPSRDQYVAPPGAGAGGATQDPLACSVNAVAVNTSTSTAMMTAHSALGGGGGGGTAGASGGNSLLSSNAEEVMAAAVPHGWVVIDAAAGAGAGGDHEGEEEGEEKGEDGEEEGGHDVVGKEGGGRSGQALTDALKVQPDAWKHLAPAGNGHNHSGSNANNTAAAAAAGGRGSLVTSGSNSTAPVAAVVNMALKVPATAAAMGPMMMKQTWMVMEFCDRGCVQDAVDRGWLRTERDCLHSEPNWLAVVATAYDMASALQYLHAHDVVHGDLTGWNVMLSSSGAGSTVGGRGFVAKVADFGLSRCMEMRTTIQTKTYGTLSHMPPELLGQGTMSKAVDVYSFGVLLWQMYTGSRPWSGLTHGQIIVKVVQERQRLQWGPDVLPAYRQLADACMSYDPEERPGFAAVVETLDVLRAALSDN